MKVLYIAAECKPFAKAGGVGDVTGELPPVLKQLGIDIEIVTPLFGCSRLDGFAVKDGGEFEVSFNGQSAMVDVRTTELHGVPVTFLGNETYFGGDHSTVYVNSEKIPFYDDAMRFSFFSEACLRVIAEKQPDIVHINDWVLGYLFGRMAMQQFTQKRVLTIHNIGYQGNMSQADIQGWTIEEILHHDTIGPLFVDPHPTWNSINPLRLALELADRANTVSPTYKEEMTLPEDPTRFFEGGKGLHETTKKLSDEGRMIGILNGFEYKSEPTDETFASTLEIKKENKAALGREFPNPDNFLLGFVGRAVEQKFRLLTEEIDGKCVLEHILEIDGVNVAMVASGLPEYEAVLHRLQDRPNFSPTVAFDREKAGQINLGSDVFLMPSLFEPCGITQLESMNCATPPLVRWTGGLVDTVVPHTSAGGTGFGFDGESNTEVLRNLISCVHEAMNFYADEPNKFEALQKRGFFSRFLWSSAAKRYIEELYEPVMD